MSCNNCENCKSQQPTTQPEHQIHYMLVRVDTDKDIETISNAISFFENSLGALTRIDVEQIQSLTAEDEEQDGGPVIYWP